MDNRLFAGLRQGCTVLAKFCGADTPTEIAEWGENHREELIQWLKLKRASMPEQSTYRRIMAHKVYRLERKFQWRRNGKYYSTSREVEFGITSLTRAEAPPERLLEIRRAHWGIETGSYYRRDVTL